MAEPAPEFGSNLLGPGVDDVLQLMTGLPLISWTTDLDLRITSCQGGGLAALGLRPQEVVGLTLEQFFEGSAAADATMEAHRLALSRQSSIWEQAWAGQWYQAHVIARQDPAGRVAGTIGLAIEVTQRHLAEAALRESEGQLRQAQKMEAVGQLAGGVAHDFNNLLTVISGYTELILTREFDQESRDQLEQIRAAAKRAGDLTRQLLLLGRRQVLSARPVDLNRLVADSEQLLRRALGESIEVEIRLLARSVARCDPGQIEQVILQLAVNARDAMPEGGRLTIETADAEIAAGSVPGLEPGAWIVLTMSDTGQGMDAALRERVFEPFFTTKPSALGSGLGLSMVYGIVRQCGGHVTLTSEPGKGSAFRVFLPPDASHQVSAITGAG